MSKLLNDAKAVVTPRNIYDPSPRMPWRGKDDFCTIFKREDREI